MKDLLSIIDAFAIKGTAAEVTPLGEGLINDTYLVRTAGDDPDYVLQKINHNIFKDVEGMQHNIELVTSHIHDKLSALGVDELDRKILNFIRTKDSGKTYFFDGKGYWRVSLYISGSVTLKEVTINTANVAGKSFGNFQELLADIDADLKESIPCFHNMEYRLAQLQEAIDNDPVDRVKDVKDLIEEISNRKIWMCQPEVLFREGLLPKRICHCDTKVNNILFDKDGEVLCVIDLDTVMPSFIYSDYSDFLRTGAATAPEDEPDLDKIDFDMDIFKSFTRGYLSEAKRFLTKQEIEWMPDSVVMFPYMQAVRFLTDYINGDTYYKISYPEHNLVRTKAQLRLVNRIEEKLPEIRKFIKETASL